MKILRKLEVYLRDRRLRKLEEILGYNLIDHAGVISELIRRYTINLAVNNHIMRSLDEYRIRINEMSEAIDAMKKVDEK